MWLNTVFIISLLASQQTTEEKGRELDASPLEAPRSALHENDAKPRPMGRVPGGLVQLKIRGFLVRP
jgi:hypothetical protein